MQFIVGIIGVTADKLLISKLESESQLLERNERFPSKSGL